MAERVVEHTLYRENEHDGRTTQEIAFLISPVRLRPARRFVRLMLTLTLLAVATTACRPSKSRLEVLHQMADDGFASAQYELALMYSGGADVPRDEARAIQFHQAAAQQGYARAQHALGVAYRDGTAVEQSLPQAYVWFSLAALNAAESRRREFAGDRDTVEDMMAGEQIAEAHYRLGKAYDLSKGITFDGREVVRWYRSAADQGHVDAQSYMGREYQHGYDLPQDHAEAVRWYRLAAEQGDIGSQYSLGSAYEFGEGVAQDFAEAARWYLLSGEAGDSNSQSLLGRMYANGVGVAQDHAEAARWNQRAAEQGDLIAQHALSLEYAKGIGLPQDRVQAYMWLSILLRQPRGDDLIRERSELAEQMTAEQIARAERLAGEWEESWEW